MKQFFGLILIFFASSCHPGEDEKRLTEPRWCYSTLAQIDCYPYPLVGQEDRLIN